MIGIDKYTNKYIYASKKYPNNIAMYVFLLEVDPKYNKNTARIPSME